MKGRKLFLLHKDHTVSTSHKSIAKLRSKGKLSGVKWIMIPIAATSATYIAVSADTILTQEFDSIEVAFRMRFMGGVHLCRSVIPDDNFDDEPHELYSYETSSMILHTTEELYNALYNIYAFRYCRECIGIMDHPDFEGWYIEVTDLEVTFLKGLKKTDVITIQAHHEQSKVPFIISIEDAMAETVATKFGLDRDPIKSWTSIISMRDVHGTIMWEREKPEPMDLWRKNVRYVAFNVPLTPGYVILNATQYDVSLKIQKAYGYFSPIHVGDRLSQKQCAKFLPMAYCYNLPKYWFPNMRLIDSDDIECLKESLYNDWTPSTVDIFSYNVYDSADVIIFIDHIYFLMKVHQEGGKIVMGYDYADIYDCRPNIDDMQSVITVMCELTIELNPHPDQTIMKHYEKELDIFTDSYERYLPNATEVLYLLHLLEKEE